MFGREVNVDGGQLDVLVQIGRHVNRSDSSLGVQIVPKQRLFSLEVSRISELVWCLRNERRAVPERFPGLPVAHLWALLRPDCLLVPYLPGDQLAHMLLRKLHHVDVLGAAARLNKVIARVNSLYLLQDARHLARLLRVLLLKIAG